MKIFSPFKRFGDLYENRSDPESMRMLAKLYWRFLVASACGVILIICIVSGLQIMSVMRDPGMQEAGVKKTLRPSHADLQKMLQAYADRKALFHTLTSTSTSNVVDPFW